MNPKVFVSYSHDSDDYKNWVRSFADRLISEGVDTTLDQYDLQLGDMNPEFMEKNISECDYVIILISENYVKKANERKGGAGYETDVITGEIIIKGNRKKFIPVFIKINFDQAPSYLKGANSAKISNLFSYDKEYEQIYRTITGQTLKKPVLGKIRKISIVNNNDVFDIPVLLKKKQHSNWIKITFIFELVSLQSYTLPEIFKVFISKKIVKKNDNFIHINYVMPYILSEYNKKNHSPEIVYESDDYLQGFNNCSAYDKLVFEENFIRYSFLEFRNEEKMPFNGEFILGNLIFIINMIKEVLVELGEKVNILLSYESESNKQVFFYHKLNVFSTNGINTELYLNKENKFKGSFDFKVLDLNEILKFINRFLGNFSSENNKSVIPFLNIELDNLKYFYSFLFNGKQNLSI